MDSDYRRIYEYSYVVVNSTIHGLKNGAKVRLLGKSVRSAIKAAKIKLWGKGGKKNKNRKDWKPFKVIA